MGAFASGLQGVGQAASDFGQAKFDFADWQQKQRTARLNEIIQGVRLQQIQQQIKQAQQPQYHGIVQGPGGSQLGVLEDPNKPAGQQLYTQQVTPPNFKPEDLRTAVAKAATTAGLSEEEAKGVLGAFDLKATEGDFPGAMSAATSVLEKTLSGDRDPAKQKLSRILSDAAGLDLAGKRDEAQKLYDVAQRMSGAKRATPNPTLFSLIQRDYRGDQEAHGELQNWLHMQDQMRQQYGITRAMYQFGSYINGAGQPEAITAFDAVQRQKAGEELTPSGRLGIKDAIAVQQFQSEMGSLLKGSAGGGGRPGIPALRATLKAFDNPADRLIFAQVGGAAGHPTYGQENAWARNVLNQLLNSGLSEGGRQLVVSLARLNETVGRMRSVLGLPSTDNAMQMTLALVPGVQTPDSGMAEKYLDNLEAMAQQAVAIPIYQKGAGGPNVLDSPQSPAASGQPPPGAKVRDYSDILNQQPE